jgi:two-component system sensor histidine kinase KdpD
VQAETESVRNSLLAAISHDMRTPLAVIGGAASSLADPDARLNPDTRRELAQSIVDESAQMTQLIANVLDMTRLESGRQPTHFEWIAIEEVVGSALRRLAHPLSRFRVITHLEDAPPLVRADPVLLEQLVFNLIENATRHTPPGTHISISARRGVDTLELLVADDGPGFPVGIDPDELFEKFKRGRVEGAVGGVGLGLAICRAIAQAHGGEIRAERLPAGGALFVVSLPLGGEPPAAPSEDSEP